MILIQNSQSIHFDRVLENLQALDETLVVDDELMGESLSKSKNAISAIVFFELTPNALKIAELSRNERFCDPTTPIAYVGMLSNDKHLPLGCKLFDIDDTSELCSYLNKKVKMSVLVIEDDEGICEFIKTTLSKHYIVDIANDGIKGKEKIETNDYDAIVLDVMLPGIGGEDIFKLAKSRCHKTAIVVITAYDTHEREFSFKFDGVDAYVKKPFASNKEFRMTLIDAISKRHQSVQSKLFSSTKMDVKNDRNDYIKRMSSYL